jgi:hypothetical protein
MTLHTQSKCRMSNPNDDSAEDVARRLHESHQEYVQYGVCMVGVHSLQVHFWQNYYPSVAKSMWTTPYRRGAGRPR